MAIACKEWSKLSWRHLRATNILRLPVEISSPQGQSNHRNLARSIEIPGYVLSGQGSIRATTYTKNLRCRLNGFHPDQVISEAQFGDFIDTYRHLERY